MKPIELLEAHCQFKTKYDCYVLLAVSRKKDVEWITNSQEIVFRDIIKRKEDITKKYLKMKANITNFKDEQDRPYPFYLYVSANPRDARKATFALINKINGWVQEELNGADNSKAFKRLAGNFYSELMKPQSRSKTKHFLIDYDKKDNLKSLQFKLNQFGADIILIHETRHGYHLITKPFDLQKWNQSGNNEEFDCEVKTDANLFVEYITI